MDCICSRSLSRSRPAVTQRITAPALKDASFAALTVHGHLKTPCGAGRSQHFLPDDLRHTLSGAEVLNCFFQAISHVALQNRRRGLTLPEKNGALRIDAGKSIDDSRRRTDLRNDHIRAYFHIFLFSITPAPNSKDKVRGNIIGAITSHPTPYQADSAKSRCDCPSIVDAVFRRSGAFAVLQ